MDKFIAGLMIIVGTLHFSCPPKEEHQKAVDEKLSELVDERLAEDPETALVAALGIGFVNGLVNEAVKVNSYKNWWIFSTAKIGDATTFGILNHVFIIDKSSKKTQTTSPQTASPEKANKYKGKRKDICNFIDEQDGCRIAAITKKTGDVAISKNNAYICTGAYPRGLGKALEEINSARHRISDVCLTDAGNYVVLFGRNGYRGNGLPMRMSDVLTEYNNNNEKLYCAALNDAGDWVVVSDKHYNASSAEFVDWLKSGQSKYGQLRYVAITNDARIAIFEHGHLATGNCPKDLLAAFDKSGFHPEVVKIARDSWFFADKTGKHRYSM